MEKVVVSEYVFLGLIMTDFIACFAGAILRGMFDWYQARNKVRRRQGVMFRTRVYLAENWDKIAVSLVSSFLLLLIVPQATGAVAEWLLGREVTWNSGVSGLLGLMGYDIVATIHKRARLELRRLQQRDRLNSFLLLSAVVLGVLAGSSCSVPHHVAERRVERKWQKISDLVHEYPDLASKVGTKRIDTLYLPGATVAGTTELPQDTMAYDSLLQAYVDIFTKLNAIVPCPVISSPGTAPVPPRTLPAQQQAQLQRELQKLKEQLRQGAYRDTTWIFQEAGFKATIHFTDGKFRHIFELEPQRIPVEAGYDLNLKEPSVPVWQKVVNTLKPWGLGMLFLILCLMAFSLGRYISSR